MFGGDIVLALPFAELDDRNLLRFDKSIDLLQKGVGHDAHQRRGRHRLAAGRLERRRNWFQKKATWRC